MELKFETLSFGGYELHIRLKSYWYVLQLSLPSKWCRPINARGPLHFRSKRDWLLPGWDCWDWRPATRSGETPRETAVGGTGGVGPRTTVPPPSASRGPKTTTPSETGTTGATRSRPRSDACSPLRVGWTLTRNES